MANEQNLLKGDDRHNLTVEEASKGGKASGEARRRKKQLRECLEILLEREAGKDNNGEPISGAEAISIAQMKKALKGDTRAFEVIRDTAGQKPIEKVMMADVDAEVIAEVDKLVHTQEEVQDEQRV